MKPISERWNSSKNINSINAMAKHEILIKPVSLLNFTSCRYDGSEAWPSLLFWLLLLVSLVFALLVAVGFEIWLGLFVPVFISLLYVVILCIIPSLASNTPYARTAHGAASCYLWSLRSAIKCPHPAGVAFILGGLLEQLDKLGLGDKDPYKYSKNGGVYGFPDVAKLRTAKVYAEEIASKQQSIVQLGNSIALAQSIEIVKQMLRPEDVWFNDESLRLYKANKLSWFSWSDEDQAAYERSQFDHGVSYERAGERDVNNCFRPNQRATRSSDTKSQFTRLMTFNEFMLSCLQSFKDFKENNPSLLFLDNEGDRRSAYNKYTDREYKKYLTEHRESRDFLRGDD